MFKAIIVVFTIIAAAFAGEQGVRQERATVVSSYGAWPYSAAYAPVTAYSAGVGVPVVSSYSAYPYAYNGYYGGVPVARAFY